MYKEQLIDGIPESQWTVVPIPNGCKYGKAVIREIEVPEEERTDSMYKEQLINGIPESQWTLLPPVPGDCSVGEPVRITVDIPDIDEEEDLNEESLVGKEIPVSIRSFEEEFTGDIYPMFVFDKETHLSISGIGNFRDCQKVVIHMQDAQGNYEDMFYPSLKTFNKSAGTSEDMRKLKNIVFRFPKLIRNVAKLHPKVSQSDIVKRK